MATRQIEVEGWTAKVMVHEEKVIVVRKGPEGDTPFEINTTTGEAIFEGMPMGKGLSKEDLTKLQKALKQNQ